MISDAARDIAERLSDAHGFTRLEGASSAPSRPGYCAFWSDLSAIGRVQGTPFGARFLYYVGGTAAGEDLRARLATHRAGTVGASTLRLSLAAVRGGDGDWVSRDETALTEWMQQHLAVSWVECATGKEVTAALIGAMRPPLNSDYNSDHPEYPIVRDARAEFRSRVGSGPQSATPKQRSTAAEPSICPVCFQSLPASGVCDCAEN